MKKRTKLQADLLFFAVIGAWLKGEFLDHWASAPSQDEALHRAEWYDNKQLDINKRVIVAQQALARLNPFAANCWN